MRVAESRLGFTPTIRVKYDKSLLSEETPYLVHLDKIRLSELLSSEGMPDEQIAKRTLILKQNIRPYILSNLLQTTGQYNPLTTNTTICTDYWWKRFNSHLRYAEKMKKGKILPRSLYFKPEIKDASFPIDVAHNQLSEEAIREILLVGINRELNRSTLHEMGHLLDLRHPLGNGLNSLWKIVDIGGSLYIINPIHMLQALPKSTSGGIDVLSELAIRTGLFAGFYLATYAIDPFEIRARKFSKDTDIPKWQGIISLEPKGR